MGEFITAAAAIDPAEPPDLVCAGTFPTRHAARDHGLVVLAMGLPYWLEEDVTGSRFGILVEPAYLAAVRAEFDQFDSANVNWPPPAFPAASAGSTVTAPWLTPALWAVVVAWVFQWQIAHWDFALSWGALDGAQLFHAQQWWRPFTALFLHADVMHVTANLAIGIFVFTQLIAQWGVWRGWRNLVFASILANVVTAALHLASGVTSIGASTAVFAGIGLLTGQATRAAFRHRAWLRWRGVLVALGAGAVLLGLLGAGGARVDVLAHAAGFAVGVVCGLLSAGPQKPSLPAR